MAKNAIVFTLQANSPKSMHYYAMAHYALETLQPFYTGDYDIIFYHDVSGFDFDNDKYNSEYNIKNDFPWVEYIKSPYKELYSIPDVYARGAIHDAYMCKWYHLQETFKRGYDKLFMLDLDVTFIRDPGYFFEKYDDPTSFRCDDEIIRLLLKKCGWSSAHIIVKKEHIGEIDTFYDRVAIQRKILYNRSKLLWDTGKISQFEHENFCFFSEQYSGQLIIEKRKRFVSFDHDDVYWKHPIEKIVDDEITLKPQEATIVHYSTAASGSVLPARLFDHNLQAFKKELINKKDEVWHFL